MNSSLRSLASARVLLGNIVRAQQAAVGHQDHPLDRKARQHLAQHAFQGLGLADIAGMHRVHQRQSLGGLDHASTN